MANQPNSEKETLAWEFAKELHKDHALSPVEKVF